MEVENLTQRLEERVEQFRDGVDARLDDSRLDSTDREDEYNRRVAELYRAADRLNDDYDRSDRRSDTRRNVQSVRSAAARVDQLMRNVRALQTSGLRDRWARIRTDVNRLCDLFDVSRL
jgi:hypothetical protein